MTDEPELLLGQPVKEPSQSGFLPATTFFSNPYKSTEHLREAEAAKVEQINLQKASFLETTGAAITESNTLVNVLSAAQEYSAMVEDTIAEEEIDIGEFAELYNIPDEDLHLYEGVSGPRQAYKRLENIEEQRQADKLIAANPVQGFASYFAAQPLELANYYLPLRSLSAAKKAQTAARPLYKTAAASLTEAGTTELGIEAVLMNTQQERTLGEAAANVAASAVFTTGFTVGVENFIRGNAKLIPDSDRFGSIKAPSAEEIAAQKPGARSVGAAMNPSSTPDAAQLAEPEGKIAKVIFKTWANTLGRIGPGGRLMTQGTKEHMDGAHALTSSSLVQKRHAEGQKTAEGDDIIAETKDHAVETLVEHRIHKTLGQARAKAKSVTDAYYGEDSKFFGVDTFLSKMTTRVNGKMSPAEIRVAVGKAMVRNDLAEDLGLPAKETEVINQIAKSYREEVYEPATAELIRLGVFEPDIAPETAASYLNRVYLKEMVKARPAEFFEATLSAAQKMVDDALVELKPEVQRMRSRLDKMKDKESQKYKDLETKYIEARNELDDLINNPKGVMHELQTNLYNTIAGLNKVSMDKSFVSIKSRGPMKERTLMVDDIDLEKIGILEKDIDILAARFSRITSGEIELINKFGTSNFDEYKADKLTKANDAEREALIKAWDKKIAEADPKDVDKVTLAKEKAINKRVNELNRLDADMEHSWEMVRGTFSHGDENDPSAIAQRVAKVARRMAIPLNLGNVVLGSFTDVAMALTVNSMGDVMKASGSFMRAMLDKDTQKAIKSFLDSAALSGITVEHLMSSRFLQIAGVADQPHLHGTAVERVAEFMGGELFAKGSGMSTWNNMMQALSGFVSHQRLINLAKTQAKGQGLKKSDRDWLRRHGVSDADLKVFASEVETHGFREGGVWVDGLRGWADKDAAEKFKATIFASNKEMILGKNIGATPKFSESAFGSMTMQFTTHVMSANQRVMGAGLQRADAQMMQGMVAMTAMGVLTNYLIAVSKGEEISDDWKVHLYGGIDRSNMASLMTWGNQSLMEPLGLGVSNLFDDEEAQKRAQYNRGIAETLMGPTGGVLQDVANVAKGAASAAKGEGFTKAGVKSVGDLVPLGKLPGVRQGIESLEEEIIESLEE